MTVWLAHFLNFRHFGLYHDDYYFVSLSLEKTGAEMAKRIGTALIQWPQGRPIGFSITFLLSFIGDHLGGIPAIYLLACSLITLNTILFYQLLRRQHAEFFALTGGLAFALFPADTTKIFLTHGFCLQSALTFLILASLLYLSDRRVLAYIAIAGSLLAYESVFTVFFAVPLLRASWNRRLIKELAFHSAILLVMMVMAVLIRSLGGEGGDTRVAGTLSAFISGGIPAKIVAALVMGPCVSLFLFLYGPMKYLISWSPGIWMMAATFALILGFWLARTPLEQSAHRVYPLAVQSRWLTLKADLSLPEADVRLLQLLLTSLILLSLGYVLSFTHFPPTIVRGIRTSTHLAATFGGSMFFAALCTLLVSIADRYRQKGMLTSVLACYLALVLGYHQVIQLDMRQNWQNQRQFWQAVIQLCPDLMDGTTILVEREELPETLFVSTHSTFDRGLLQQIFRFPPTWRQPPQLFTARKNWPQLDLKLQGDRFIWRDPYWSWLAPDGMPLPPGKIIGLGMVNGQLTRLTTPIVLANQQLPLQQLKSTSPPAWDRGTLYEILIETN
ncbi:hypothetical protein [Leptolyngbya sp. 'hensonii']|uniref:hypothetical protein n=1 Tax=Leptolyngbya sp. 'hensonii' TaxID=1922337 RepID=UPI001C0B2D8C|nr:hypothetical protein [Leptolyngbya sp. 'hensonii']